jgi:hypothetical protein
LIALDLGLGDTCGSGRAAQLGKPVGAERDAVREAARPAGACI